MSKVVLIGDRAVGKTSTVHALCTPPYEKVEPQEGPSGDVAQTESIEIKKLIIIVELPAGNIELSLVWIDTPGELQSNRQKQEDNPEIWNKFCQEVQTSDYVMLLLPPHQGLCNKKNILDIDTWPTALQSETRFKEWWISFLSQNCRQPSNILICRHQSDLLIPDIIKIGNKYKYANEGFSWKKYFDFTNSYFPEIDSEISTYRRTHRRQEIRLFVTTIKNRSLLELPWTYIATRESSRPKY
jgi:GTPase SAR1 family protein